MGHGFGEVLRYWVSDNCSLERDDFVHDVLCYDKGMGNLSAGASKASDTLTS